MKKPFTLFILAALLFSAQKSTAQTDGTLDSTFNSDGIYTHNFGNNDILNDATMQPDQKIICTGVALTASFSSELKVVRLETDGTPDNTFGVNGVFSLLIGQETHGYESYVRADGKIIVAGISYDANYYADMMLLRLKDDGTLDSTFGTNGITLLDFFTRDDIAQALTVQADGKIIVSGTFNDTTNYYNIPTIVRFTESGIVDSTFGTNGYTEIPADYTDNELTSVVVQPDGKIVAAGHFQNTFTGSTDFDILVMRVDTDGVFDATFGTNGVVKTPINGGVDDSFGMEIDAAGNIVVAGFTTLPVTLTFNMVLLKYVYAAGTLVPGFGNAGIVEYTNPIDNYANDLKIQADNKIIVGGSIGSIFAGAQDFTLWRYLPSGVIDSTFGINGLVETNILGTIQDCNSLVIQNDGKIVAAGKAHNGTNLDIAVARYLNDGTTSVNEISFSDDINLFPNPVLQGNNFQVRLNSQSQLINGHIDIFNVTGEKVYSEKLSSNTHTVNCKSFASGIYFVKVNDGKKQFTGKLIVEKD